MTNRDILLGFLTGAIAGAAVALLYAPQSGEETRLRIRETGYDAGQKARDAGARVKDSVVEMKSGVERSVTEAASKAAGSAERVVTAVERGREAFKTALADA